MCRTPPHKRLAHRPKPFKQAILISQGGCVVITVYGTATSLSRLTPRCDAHQASLQLKHTNSKKWLIDVKNTTQNALKRFGWWRLDCDLIKNLVTLHINLICLNHGCE